MKVLAQKDNSYICEVGHSELERYLDLYYNKLDTLSVDQVIDLGKSHDFHSATIRALEKTNEFFKTHESTVRAIANGFLSELNNPEDLDLTLGEDLD